ncbi:MAG: glycosyltransferase family 4 protein [Bacteroidetes bacterium SB0662_bin_6]|nr:glycosyltransferase family 4 protein [Bacteroidetes bacterium SB0668_bin_1]MYE03845.1 glycosyltransferase family 4 protein [Bacteroidetes bacterium SB0662_bin_6]
MLPKLLFVYIHPASFVREDIRLLEEAYEVVSFRFGGAQKPGLFAFAGLFCKQLFWLLRELPGAVAVYGWFVDYHMVLPVAAARCFRKPVLAVVGGFDAVSLPSLGHGVALTGWRRRLARMVFRRADALLPVSPSLVRSKNRFSEGPEAREYGFRMLAPDTPAAVLVVPTGYDPGAWPAGPDDRAPVVGTVGFIDEGRTFRIKGIDLFLDAARLMPDVRFRIVGVRNREAIAARYDPPPNVEMIPPVPREQLPAQYHEMSVYVQLSRAEGFPNVLCEAMLCGCVPVGSRVFGIPDCIGEAGFLVDESHASAVCEAIRAALRAADPVLRTAARARIERFFHRDRRREKLLTILAGFTGGGRHVR